MQSASRTPEQRQAGLATARILLETKSIGFRPEEPFTLTSGWKTPVYVDCRRLISFPRARKKITEMAAQALTREIGFESIDAVAGGETAGIPFAAWISDALSLPMLYVRKQAKGFGRNAQIEGAVEAGDRAVLVEDLASDGTSKVNFCKALRTAGMTVNDCFVVFFYGVFPEALKTLEEIDVRLHFLANWWDVFDVAEQDGSLDRATVEEVRRFLHDPVAWSSLHGGRAA
ncbi:MAG TPA: orotate phosphoribosyltransferase [Magnetospirillaceae bacterium]|jgi:orotate phosphoribosyltransferase